MTSCMHIYIRTLTSNTFDQEDYGMENTSFLGKTNLDVCADGSYVLNLL